MPELTSPPRPYGNRARGVSGSDVERAADQLLRAGERPTVEKIRMTLGTGSPNTINPLLDSWWKRIGTRLDAGPAALHRLPETVAHVAEALWMQALEEARRRVMIELRGDKRDVDQAKEAFEVRSHVLTLREGELDSRLRDRERSYMELEARLRTLTTLLQKEQKTREALAERIAELEAVIAAPREGVVGRRRPYTVKVKSRTRRRATVSRKKRSSSIAGKALRKRSESKTGAKKRR